MVTVFGESTLRLTLTVVTLLPHLRIRKSLWGTTKADTKYAITFPSSLRTIMMLYPTVPEAAKRFLAFINASPTPFHAVQNAAVRLEEAGFRKVCRTLLRCHQPA